MEQDQLGKAISAIGGSLMELLRGDKTAKLDEKMLMTALSDAGRILTDLHYRKSVTRRAFTTPGISPVVKTIADGSPVGALLFGEDVSDRVKTAKAMETSTKRVFRSSPLHSLQLGRVRPVINFFFFNVGVSRGGGGYTLMSSENRSSERRPIYRLKKVKWYYRQ